MDQSEELVKRIKSISASADGSTEGVDFDYLRIEELRALCATLLPDTTEHEVGQIVPLQLELEAQQSRLAKLLDQGLVSPEEFAAQMNREADLPPEN